MQWPHTVYPQVDCGGRSELVGGELHVGGGLDMDRALVYFRGSVWRTAMPLNPEHNCRAKHHPHLSLQVAAALDGNSHPPQPHEHATAL